MSYFLIYLVKSTVYLALFYAFFMIAMRGTTFFRFNRVMLLLGTFLCMLLPLYTITVDEMEGVQLPMQVLDEMLVIRTATTSEVDVSTPTEFPLQEIETTSSLPLLPYLLLGIYSLGAFVYLVVVIRSFAGIWKLIASYPKQWENGCWLILIPAPIPSFSWSNYIVISEEDYRHYPQVMVHERMHYLCRHSYDILFMTLVNILHWFNPMVWIIRTELKQLHEFEADEGVIHQGIDATQYQLLLVRKAVGKKLYTIANGFNHTKLKKRITMMIQEKTNGWERLKWLVSVPLVTGAMLVFAQPEVKNKLEGIIPPETVQEEPKDWESLRNFFIEQSTPYRKYLIAQGNDVKDANDKRLTHFRVNKNNQIMISDCYDTRPQDFTILKTTDEIRPYLVQAMREARRKRSQELGKDEVRGIFFQHDIGAHPDSLYNYLKQIKLAYEDLRKEYQTEGNPDKKCPMWVHFQTPRYFSQKNKKMSGKIDITVFDAKDGTLLGKAEKIKHLNRLGDVLNILPNGCPISVSFKVAKDTPTDEVTAIKETLKGYYTYQIRMED